MKSTAINALDFLIEKPFVLIILLAAPQHRARNRFPGSRPFAKNFEQLLSCREKHL